MKKKKWSATVIGLVLTAVVFMGVIAIAAEYGGKDDPLVSLSYINSVFAPDLQAKIDKNIENKINAFSNEVDNKLSSYSNNLDKKIAEFTAENASFAADSTVLESIAQSVASRVGNKGQTASFTLVKLSAGQVLRCSVGTEVLLRLGSAVCVSSGTPGLIDTTSAKNLPGGSALSKNHLYLCTVNGRGVSAPSGATVLVRGGYSIE